MRLTSAEPVAAPAEAEPPRSFGAAGRQSRHALLAAPVRWPHPSALDRPLSTLSGVGPRLSEAALETGLRTIGDLLMRIPHSHRDRTIEPLSRLEPGRQATVCVEVLGARPRPFRRRGLSIVSVKVGDQSGTARATWFNQPWVAQRLTQGTQLLLTGSLDRRGFRVAEYEFAAPDGGRGFGWSPEAETLVPVHPATKRLRPQRLRNWVWQARAWLGDVLEPLPAELRARRGLAGVADALRAVHFPEEEADIAEARRRLAFEELFLYQAMLAARKRAHRVARPAPRLGRPGERVASWIESLPFAPTRDQRSAFKEIEGDLDSGQPMQRLLMGEVGSGKTVVALYAMLRALEAGFQAVLMAPTETLAEQHAATLDRLLAHEPLQFALLTGATPAARRKLALDRLSSGELSLAVGTHALIELSVELPRLGLCVVDEQHRFGVEQRRALDAKGVDGMAPHVLHMTATPIPRTLALAAYGDLDMTALHELPAGRGQVETRLLEEHERAAAYGFVRKRLREGRQAYVVCPLVSESERLQGKAAEEEARRLEADELRGFAIGVLHGQMASSRKAEVMKAFASGSLDVLVATTVVEVGIDVPNATVMLIEGAERYGVSQLHQLRGRVGRGEHRSHCLLFSAGGGELARRRLQAVAREQDGFKLAEIDLGMRGEGEIIGTRQHGLPRFGIAELPDDTATLFAASDEVAALLNRHGSLDAPCLSPLMEAARRRFGADGADPIPL